MWSDFRIPYNFSEPWYKCSPRSHLKIISWARINFGVLVAILSSGPSWFKADWRSIQKSCLKGCHENVQILNDYFVFHCSWKDTGENHLIFNMLPGGPPDFNQSLDIPLGHAIQAGGGMSVRTYRPYFDISIPVFNALTNRSIKLKDQGWVVNTLNVSSLSVVSLFLDLAWGKILANDVSINNKVVTGSPYNHGTSAQWY